MEVDKIIIFAGLIFVNFLVIYFVKSDKKYVKGPITIWTATLIICMTNLMFIFPYSKKKIDHRYSTFANKTEHKINKFDNNLILRQINTDRVKLYRFNRQITELCGLQTLITFIFLNIFYNRNNKDNKKKFSWTLILFGIMTFLFLFFELLMSIVPSSGFIG